MHFLVYSKVMRSLSINHALVLYLKKATMTQTSSGFYFFNQIKPHFLLMNTQPTESKHNF